MLDKLKKIRNDELVKGGITLFILINLANVLNYVFHFSMARMLGPADYGILAVLMSLVYFTLVPAEAMQTIITKYTTKLNIKKEYGKIKSLLYKSFKKEAFIGIILFILFIPIAFILSWLLKIDVALLLLTGVILFYMLSIPLVRGILQGRKNFTELGLNMVFESSSKVVLSIILVFLGFRVYGAIIGTLTACLLAFVFSFFFIKKIISSKKQEGDFKGIYSYGLPVLFAMLPIILISSLDIIIAKVVFAPEIAGKYAVASMFGKMIFFGNYSFGKTMFSFSSENHESGKTTSGILRKTLKMSLTISGVALLIYLFLPRIIINLLFGGVYIEIANILFIVGLGFTFISLSNIMLLHALSLNKKVHYYQLSAFILLEVILLSVFSANIMQFSLAFLAVNFLMFVYTLFMLKK